MLSTTAYLWGLKKKYTELLMPLCGNKNKFNYSDKSAGISELTEPKKFGRAAETGSLDLPSGMKGTTAQKTPPRRRNIASTGRRPMQRSASTENATPGNSIMERSKKFWYVLPDKASALKLRP